MIYFYLILPLFISIFFVRFIRLGENFIQLLLSFSGSYLLSITLIHLLPELYIVSDHQLDIVFHKDISIFILGGIFIQIILEFFSKGAEHGHIHLEEDKTFPWTLFISLCIHAFFEGISLNYSKNSHFLSSIIVHKLPIFMLLISFFFKNKYNRRKIYFFMMIFSLMTPLGLFISAKIGFFQWYHRQVMALTVGIFFHISTVILFESSENHKFNIFKFFAIVLGISLVFL